MKKNKIKLIIPICLLLAFIIPVLISSNFFESKQSYLTSQTNNYQETSLKTAIVSDLEVEVDMIQDGDMIEVVVKITNNNPDEISNVKLEEIWESAASFTATKFNATKWDTLAASESVYTTAEVTLLELSSFMPLDFAITIDASGSMGGEIDAIQDSLIDILNILRTKSSVRTGISVFGWDSTHGYNPYLTPETLTVELTEDIDTVINYVNSLYASGGSEPLGDSFYQMNRNWDWRADAQKVIVIIGDEPDNAGTMVDDYSGTYTLQQEAEYTSLNNIQVVGIQSGYEREDTRIDQQVFVNETNGLYKFFGSGQEDQLASFIINGIDQLKKSLPLKLELNLTYDLLGTQYSKLIKTNYYCDANSKTYIGEPVVSISGSMPTYIDVATNIYDKDGISQAIIEYRYGEIMGETINWGSWANASLTGDAYGQFALSPDLTYNTQNTFVFQFEIIAIDGEGQITTKSDFCKPYWTVKPNVTDNIPVISEIQRSPINVTESEEVIINATLMDDFGINSANLIYRINGGTWQEVNMNLVSGTFTSGTWEYNFGQLTAGMTVEYYVEAYDTLYQKIKDDNNGLKYLFKVRGESGQEDYSFPSIIKLAHTPKNPSIIDDIVIELNLTDNIDINQDSVNLLWTRDSSFLNPNEISLTSANSGTDENSQPWYFYQYTISATGSDEDLFYKITARDTAYNQIESNIKTVIFNTPESCLLSSNADNPDTDGDYRLSWSPSEGADYYRLYTFHSPITEINDSLTVVEDEMTELTKDMVNMETGVYYYAIMAYNSTGYSLSNSIEIEVDLSLATPEAFTLFSDEDENCTDGALTLTWEVSRFAQKYSIYMSDEEIADINENCSLIAENLKVLVKAIDSLENGRYYFVAVAYNGEQYIFSNNVDVDVMIDSSNADAEEEVEDTNDNSDNSGEEDRNNTNTELTEGLQSFALIFWLTVIGIAGYLVYHKYRD